jgi:ribonuclease BN (tRNA processing enzyme)
VETGGKSFCYITDDEFLQGYLGHPLLAEKDETLLAPYRKILDFVTGTDLLIAEAQYTNEEYLTKIGWGHSSVSNACLLAKIAQVEDWIVVHHDPQHDDSFVENKANTLRRIARDIGYGGLIRSGYDGMTEYLD